jgi:uncharacterized metal-binding protein YceD (DUF177 family)
MSDRGSAARPWSVPVVVADIPDAGRRVDLVPDAETRAAIASAVGAVAMPRLEAAFDLTRYGGDGVHVLGWVSATVSQTCVVTLDPVQNEVEEDIDLVFTAEPAAGSGIDAGAASGLEEVPEALRDGVIDLGAVATEFLILGIDPYPRKPGAEFEAPAAGEAGGHPFAALAALKKERPR